MSNFFNSSSKKFEDISFGEFNDQMILSNHIIIDVRSQGEFQSGKIAGARNIDLSGDFQNQVKNLPKDKTYLLYCRSGARSSTAAAMMAEIGFEKVKNLRGGIMNWPFQVV